MYRLFADGAGLAGLSEPGVHTATVISMSTGKYSKLVPILIFIQTDGTDVIFISWERKGFTQLLAVTPKKTHCTSLIAPFSTKPVQT